ncbi:MAG: hypothetical protein VZS12_08630 [Ruminococcus bromii]|nr:hypothetical protein [Ruminococcus bromii]
MTTINTDVKAMAKNKGVFYYEIAGKLGMIDTAFSRKLRRELPPDEKQRIFSIIDEIAAEKKSAAQNVAAL